MFREILRRKSAPQNDKLLFPQPVLARGVSWTKVGCAATKPHRLKPARLDRASPLSGYEVIQRAAGYDFSHSPVVG